MLLVSRARRSFYAQSPRRFDVFSTPNPGTRRPPILSGRDVTPCSYRRACVLCSSFLAWMRPLLLYLHIYSGLRLRISHSCCLLFVCSSTLCISCCFSPIRSSLRARRVDTCLRSILYLLLGNATSVLVCVLIPLTPLESVLINVDSSVAELQLGLTCITRASTSRQALYHMHCIRVVT